MLASPIYYRCRATVGMIKLDIVEAEGVIRYAHVSPQLNHVPDIYELYGVLDSLQVGEAVEAV